MDILCYFAILPEVCSDLQGYLYLSDTMKFALKNK